MINNCPYLIKLSAYIDGELTQKDSGLIHEHLQGCSACQNELHRLKSADRMISKIRNIEPSPHFDQVFWKKINSFKEKKKKNWSFKDVILWGMKPRFAAATFAAMMAIVVMWYVEKGGSKWTPAELAISNDLQFYSELDMVSHLDMLEHWDEIMTIHEQN